MQTFLYQAFNRMWIHFLNKLTNYYTKEEVDNLSYITEAEIDTIWAEASADLDL